MFLNLGLVKLHHLKLLDGQSCTVLMFVLSNHTVRTVCVLTAQNTFNCCTKLLTYS